MPGTSSAHLSWPLNQQAYFLPRGLSCGILGSTKFLTLKSLVGKGVYLSDGGPSRTVAKAGIAENLFDEEQDLLEGDMMFSSCEYEHFLWANGDLVCRGTRGHGGLAVTRMFLVLDDSQFYSLAPCLLKTPFLPSLAWPWARAYVSFFQMLRDRASSGSSLSLYLVVRCSIYS